MAPIVSSLEASATPSDLEPRRQHDHDARQPHHDRRDPEQPHRLAEEHRGEDHREQRRGVAQRGRLGSGSRPSAVKPRPMAVVPTSPRQRWPIGLRVCSPRRSFPSRASRARITGTAKNERKNTASPGGICGAVALMQTASGHEEGDR